MTEYKADEILKKIDVLSKKTTIGDVFTDSDIELIKTALKAFRGLEALGSLASFMKRVVVWIGIMVSSYIAFKNGLIDYLTGLLGMN